jgi:hypothetical protein
MTSTTPTTTPAVQRVLDAFAFTFPPIGIVVLIYAALGDPVFAINRFLGHRLYTRVRRAVRRLYEASNAALFAGLHVGLLWGCWSRDAQHDCAARPLHARPCLFAASLVAVAHLGAVLLDRVAVPLLSIDAKGFAVGWRARVVEASAVGVLWLALSEADGSALALAAVICARRALGAALGRRGAFGALLLWKAGVIVRATRVLTGAEEGVCTEAQRRMAIATMGAAVAL